MLEYFIWEMLESEVGKKLLQNWKKQFKKQISPLRYTIVDYINSIDFIVRSMEEGKCKVPAPEIDDLEGNSDSEKEESGS